MPIMEVSISKQTLFQGQQDVFSNRYMFEVPELNQATGEALINAVVAAEKALHASDVEFVHGRAFTTGPLGSGSMYATLELDGFGARAPAAAMYRECAVLVQWPLPRGASIVPGALGRYRSLKKWLHANTLPGATNGELAGTAALTAATKQPFRDYAAAIEAIPAGDLCAPDGAKPNGPAFVQDYMEHRQFPRGRKE